MYQRTLCSIVTAMIPVDDGGIVTVINFIFLSLYFLTTLGFTKLLTSSKLQSQQECRASPLEVLFCLKKFNNGLHILLLIL